ncbi:hypothetical protein NMG60_11023021 [Bertholletia excelsa]
MPCWSAKNATRAYLQALTMRGKEPDVAEFISALAAGNSAHLMVMACAGVAGSNALALVAAAHQTGGRVVVVLSRYEEVQSSREALGDYAHLVKFVTGEAQTLLQNDLKGADFVLIDCDIDDPKGPIVVGYNALRKGPLLGKLKAHLLPIGEGLVVARVGGRGGGNKLGGCRKKSLWIVKVDKGTGEEHVYRVPSPHGKEIEA